MPAEYTIQRLRGELAIVWKDETGRRRYSLGTANRPSAEAAARAFWQKRATRSGINTVGQAVEAYLIAKEEMISHYKASSSWNSAKPFWANMPISRIDEDTCDAYREFRKQCRAQTVRNELATIRAALNMAERKKLIERAPFIKMPKLPPRKIKHLTRAQFRQLLEGAKGPHIRLFMMLAIATGARMTALLELTWDRVNLEVGVVDLNPVDRVQTSKYRAVVRLNAQIINILAEARAAATSDYVIEYAGRKVGSVKTGWNAAVRRSGVVATPHMLRHSAAVWMAEAGQPMSVIAQFLGHSDSRLTERVYARFSPDFLSGAAEALTW